jgi:hypothetical protein
MLHRARCVSRVSFLCLQMREQWERERGELSANVDTLTQKIETYKVTRQLRTRAHAMHARAHARARR